MAFLSEKTFGYVREGSMTIAFLREALARDQVILVAGTGVSAATGNGSPTSTWIGLIDDGISRIEKQDPNRGALLRMRLETFEESLEEERRVSDLTNIATELRQEFEREDEQRFGRWLDRALGSLAVADSTVAKALERLEAPIFTTNYDTLIERGLNRGSATWTQPDLMRKIAKGDSPEIGHLHGIFSDAKSVIFTEGDYGRVLGNAAAQAVQTSAFTMKTFLFVGFGAGTQDPNFKLMIDNFGNAFGNTAGAHYRLCLSEEVREGSDLEPVTDLAYGNSFEDLSGFLDSLRPDRSLPVAVDKRARSFDGLAARVRDNSTLWRDNESLEEKTVQELVVPPIFLPEPHDQYATSTVLDNDRKRLEPLEILDIAAGTKIVLIAGEENAGVSTALAWILNEALLVDASLHAHFIEDALVAGPRPLTKKLARSYRSWGIDPFSDEDLASCVVAVDNLRYESSEKFDRAISDIAALQPRLMVIGVRQQDALELANALTEAGVSNVSIAYLGRFSNGEAHELARRVSPGGERRLVTAVMIVIREKRLPRNPFTITLLLELIRNGSKLKKQESEIAVLDQYLDLLLIGDFFREMRRDDLTLRNKRVVLVAVARKLVERKEDRAQQSELVKWVQDLFHELGWPHDALSCVEDLVRRRVLSKGPDNTIQFQRSAYLELMAGIAAQEDEKFRELVFASPLELASIVRTYAAMSRNDANVLRLMESQIDLINVVPPTGSVFARVRQLEAPAHLFADGGEAVDSRESDSKEVVEREKINESYYDDTDDTDRPAFLTARLEDLPPGRIAMLVVDLASRVLRDTDEIRDQELKAKLLKKVLVAWVGFVDLFEDDLRLHPDFDDNIREFFKEDENPSEKEVEAFKAMMLRVVPSFLTLSGITYCLSGPSLVPLLGTVELKEFDNADFAGIIRTLALYGSGSNTWVKSLASLHPTAARSWFSASFLASIARYAYISDPRLTDNDRAAIREFLRGAIGVRYSFTGVPAKNKAMNVFEDELRRAHLNESKRPVRSITVLG
jgi:hypothetical protein